MKLRFPEGVSHFYNSAGVEFKPDDTGHATTDHPDTIAEMLRQGFVKVEEEVMEIVHEASDWVTRLLHGESGDEVAQLPTKVEVGQTVGIEHPVDGVVDHLVVSLSQDGKTAVVMPVKEVDPEPKADETKEPKSTAAADDTRHNQDETGKA